MWNLFNKKNKTDGEHRTLQLITDKGMPFGYVEAYKSLRTNLDFMAGSMDVHTLVITSTVPEESKSNVAVNLAMTMAESGKKVALVDCDLRKPVLHRYLKAGHNVKGVSNVLSNQCTLDEALQAVDDKYNSVIMEGEYFIDDIQMAYTPVQTEETGIVRLIPVWYFQTTHQILVPNRSGTGEVMLPQSGYILINALDGTELLHSNGDI